MSSDTDDLTPFAKAAFQEIQRAVILDAIGHPKAWGDLLWQMQHALALGIVTASRGDNAKIGKILEVACITLPELAAELSKSAAEAEAFKPKEKQPK